MSPLEMLVARLEIPVAEEGAFVFCAGCQEVHRVSRSDRAPVFAPDGSSRAADDFQTFLVRHATHRLRVLRRSNDAEVHSHARHDPMCRILWEAVDDDGQRFVISLGRDDVESPRRYGITPGTLEVATESIELDEELLRAVIDEALYPGPAPVSRLDRLIEACRRAVTALPWDAFDPIDEARDDPGTQLVSPARDPQRDRGRSLAGLPRQRRPADPRASRARAPRRAPRRAPAPALRGRAEARPHGVIEIGRFPR